MSDLKERLLAKTHEMDGLHGIIEVARNPDGPAAIARIEKLEAALEKAREGFHYIRYELNRTCAVERADVELARLQALQSGEARGV